MALVCSYTSIISLFSRSITDLITLPLHTACLPSLRPIYAYLMNRSTETSLLHPIMNRRTSSTYPRNMFSRITVQNGITAKGRKSKNTLFSSVNSESMHPFTTIDEAPHASSSTRAQAHSRPFSSQGEANSRDLEAAIEPESFPLKHMINNGFQVREEISVGTV